MTQTVSEEKRETLRMSVRQFLQSRPDLSAADLAAHSTLCDSAVRNFVSGLAPGGQDVVREIGRVVEQARAGEILQPGGRNAIVISEDSGDAVRRVPRRRSYYQTQTYRRVAEVLNYCAENSAIGVITAEYGVGKTEAVKAWRRESGRKVDSLVFEFDEFSSTNKVEFIGALARMVGAEATPGQQNGGRVFRSVCDRLREQPCLLIFDQCETARPRIFQVIRQIWDRASEYGVGVVILAAPILLARMTGSRMADLGALTSRVGVWAPLSGITRAEMAAIAKQEGITDVDEAAFDIWWKATAGSMRRLLRAIDLLRAKHAGKRITEKTIAGVAGCLWGMRIAEPEAA